MKRGIAGRPKKLEISSREKRLIKFLYVSELKSKCYTKEGVLIWSGSSLSNEGEMLNAMFRNKAKFMINATTFVKSK